MQNRVCHLLSTTPSFKVEWYGSGWRLVSAVSNAGGWVVGRWFHVT